MHQTEWHRYVREPEGKAVLAAEKEYFRYRQELMLNEFSLEQRKVLEQKKQLLLSKKAALSDLVGFGSCMDQMLYRYPALPRGR